MIARAASGPEPGEGGLEETGQGFLVEAVEVDEAAGPLGLAVVAAQGGDDLVGQRLVGFEQVLAARGPAAGGFEGPDLELPARIARLLDLALAQADRLEEVPDLALVRGGSSS